MPWVDVAAALDQIRAGRASRDGYTFAVNGRTYILEPNRRLYPTVGEGLHRLSRGEYRALALYNDPVPGIDVEAMLDRERIPFEERELARRLRRAGGLE